MVELHNKFQCRDAAVCASHSVARRPVRSGDDALGPNSFVGGRQVGRSSALLPGDRGDPKLIYVSGTLARQSTLYSADCRVLCMGAYEREVPATILCAFARPTRIWPCGDLGSLGR